MYKCIYFLLNRANKGKYVNPETGQSVVDWVPQHIECPQLAIAYYTVNTTQMLGH